jgi:hypothetical protein
MTASSERLHYSTSPGRFEVAGIGAGLLTSCHFVALERMYLPLRLNELVFQMPRWEEKGLMRVMRKVVGLGKRFGWEEEVKMTFGRP